MKMIDSTHSLTILVNNKMYSMRDDNPDYAEFVRACEADDETTAVALATGGVKKLIEQKVAALDPAQEFVFTDTGVTWLGVELHGALITKITSLVKKGAKNLDNYKNFLKRLMANPSNAATNGLYDFLNVKELPIDEEGYFYAFKGVESDFWSISGNTRTVVRKGKVNACGEIFNGVGEEIEVERNQVDKNQDVFCSTGLHVGSFSYAESFARTAKNTCKGKVVLVKVDPKDVVCIPRDSGCQKARCCRYTVVAEIADEVTYSSISVSQAPDGQVEIKCEDPQPNAGGGKVTQETKDRIEAYVNKKGMVTLKAIQSSLSGLVNISCKEIEAIVIDLGCRLTYNPNEAFSLVTVEPKPLVVKPKN